MTKDIVTVKVRGTEAEYPMFRDTYESYKEEMDYELVAEVPKKVETPSAKEKETTKTVPKKKKAAPKGTFSIED